MERFELRAALPSQHPLPTPRAHHGREALLAPSFLSGPFHVVRLHAGETATPFAGCAEVGFPTLSQYRVWLADVAFPVARRLRTTAGGVLQGPIFDVLEAAQYITRTSAYGVFALTLSDGLPCAPGPCESCAGAVNKPASGDGAVC